MASRGINKVILVGNLGMDPEVKYTPQGKAVANLALATSESWKDQAGQLQEKTEWHRVVLFGKLAEIAGEYLAKGSMVYIEGKLATRKWTDQAGVEKFTTEIHLDPFSGVMQMLGGKAQDNQAAPRQQQQAQGYQAPQNPTYQAPMSQKGQGYQAPTNPAPPDLDFDDDIPF